MTLKATTALNQIIKFQEHLFFALFQHELFVASFFYGLMHLFNKFIENSATTPPGPWPSRTQKVAVEWFRSGDH